MDSLSSLKEFIVCEVGEDVVSRKLDFQLGFYNKSVKLWINNGKDFQDALALLKRNGRLTFWCTGLGKRHCSSNDHNSDIDGDEFLSQRAAKKWKVTSIPEEKSSRANELKTQLPENHGSKYSNVQYALWAEMIVGGTHESVDEPPPVPMFGAQGHRSKSSGGNLSEALTDVASRIANALSPVSSQPATHSYSSGCYSSPSKSVELQGKYIQQLKEMVNLRDIGALTDEEYEEQRSVVVTLMRKLSQTT